MITNLRMELFGALVLTPALQVTMCQTFSQLWRGRLSSSTRDFSTAVQQLVTAVCFKLRRLQPCLISSLNVRFCKHASLKNHVGVGFSLM